LKSNDKNKKEASGMTLLGKQILDVFIKEHPDAKSWIENWVADVEGSIWRIPQDIKNKYPSASFLAENVVIFNVKGNNYRLETQISYKISIVTTIWVGTHEQYDKRNKGR
jgi:mRNA interferase HigB